MLETSPAVERLPDGSLRSRVYARIGLLGNPSDGYGGKVLAVSCANFWAEATLVPSPPGQAIIFEPNATCDPTQFTDLREFESHIDGYGYNGGLRLVMAAARTLAAHCTRRGIALDPSRPFKMSYSTTIPRQRGLSGSSAIVCAALNVLLEHYSLTRAVPPAERPQLVLDAERALGITAGLQDRIVQVYGGLLLMDFSRLPGGDGDSGERPTARWRTLDAASLPQLHLIYSDKPSGKDSGAVHSAFKERWAGGDPTLRAQMGEIAELATMGAAALESKDYKWLAAQMRHGFGLRKSMFGEAALGAESLRMIDVAERAGAAASFCGSGGAVVALVAARGEEWEARLRAAAQAAGFCCEPVCVGPVHHIATGN